MDLIYLFFTREINQSDNVFLFNYLIFILFSLNLVGTTNYFLVVLFIHNIMHFIWYRFTCIC